MNYIIVKYVKLNGNEVPVIIIDDMNEVLTFTNFDDAETYKDMFQNNSDSGHRYEVKSLTDKI